MTAQAYDVHAPADVPDGGATVCGSCFGCGDCEKCEGEDPAYCTECGGTRQCPKCGGDGFVEVAVMT